MILSGAVENTYPSGHGGGGVGSEVASTVDAVDDFSGAANEVSPEVVSIEVMVLGAGAGAGEIGVDNTRAASGSEEGGPGEVGGVEMVLGAGAGAE